MFSNSCLSFHHFFKNISLTAQPVEFERPYSPIVNRSNRKVLPFAQGISLIKSSGKKSYLTYTPNKNKSNDLFHINLYASYVIQVPFYVNSDHDCTIDHLDKFLQTFNTMFSQRKPNKNKNNITLLLGFNRKHQPSENWAPQIYQRSLKLLESIDWPIRTLITCWSWGTLNNGEGDFCHANMRAVLSNSEAAKDAQSHLNNCFVQAQIKEEKSTQTYLNNHLIPPKIKTRKLNNNDNLHIMRKKFLPRLARFVIHMDDDAISLPSSIFATFTNKMNKHYYPLLFSFGFKFLKPESQSHDLSYLANELDQLTRKLMYDIAGPRLPWTPEPLQVLLKPQDSDRFNWIKDTAQDTRLTVLDRLSDPNTSIEQLKDRSLWLSDKPVITRIPNRMKLSETIPLAQNNSFFDPESNTIKEASFVSLYFIETTSMNHQLDINAANRIMESLFLPHCRQNYNNAIDNRLFSDLLRLFNMNHPTSLALQITLLTFDHDFGDLDLLRSSRFNLSFRQFMASHPQFSTNDGLDFQFDNAVYSLFQQIKDAIRQDHQIFFFSLLKNASSIKDLQDQLEKLTESPCQSSTSHAIILEKIQSAFDYSDTFPKYTNEISKNLEELVRESGNLYLTFIQDHIDFNCLSNHPVMIK